MTARLVLASTSVFRQALLQKLNVAFDCVSPDIDESPCLNESPTGLVKRLAEQKALAGAAQLNTNKHHLVIGSDQVAVINGEIIGKPITKENAIKQLMAASGQAITFYTGLALYNTQSKEMQSLVEPFTVHFRELSKAQIEYYVDTEQPLYCAGSFKSEGLGIALFKKLEGDDPNSLVGLPLIKLIDMLTAADYPILAKKD